MAWLAELTQVFILRGNQQRVNHCLSIAQRLLENGSRDMQNAVSNGYLFTVTRFMECNRCATEIRLPAALEREYIHQLNASSL